LKVFFAWGLKHMLAGLVLISAIIGLLATGSALALSAPTWAALLLYPCVCSLSLLMLAAVGNLRTGHEAKSNSMLRQQA
jgi:hypothetical protein